MAAAALGCVISPMTPTALGCVISLMTPTALGWPALPLCLRAALTMRLSGYGNLSTWHPDAAALPKLVAMAAPDQTRLVGVSCVFALLLQPMGTHT